MFKFKVGQKQKHADKDLLQYFKIDIPVYLGMHVLDARESD